VPVNKEKITVILPNHLGDVVMATPALRALRAGFPAAEIEGVVREGLEPLIHGAPWLDRLVQHDVYRRPRALPRLRSRLCLARSLRDSATVLVFPNSFSSALLAAATGAPRRVGYRRGGRGWLLSDPVAPPRENGRVVPLAMERYYLNLVCHLGCPDTGTDLELFTEPESEKACDELFARHGVDTERRLVCLAPGAGFGPSKIWPLAYFADVGRTLLEEGNTVALVHGPGEESLAAEVLRQAGPGLHSLGGAELGLALLKSVLSRASLLVCNDAGARHITAAFRVPTLVLMGPTSPLYTNLNLRRTKLLREPVDCSPCQLKVCPIDHRCMKRLLPSRVLAEARTALSDPDWTGDLHLELGR
jgi:heptosyltransferase-2